MGADNLMKILSAHDPVSSVEEWVEMAGTVIYLMAAGETVTNSPSQAQHHINNLVAKMPDSLLIVSSLGAKEALEQIKE